MIFSSYCIVYSNHAQIHSPNIGNIISSFTKLFVLLVILWRDTENKVEQTYAGSIPVYFLLQGFLFDISCLICMINKSYQKGYRKFLAIQYSKCYIIVYKTYI